MDGQVNTVSELIDFLATQPFDRKIVMAKDAEGNNYSPLAAADEGMYVAESTWSGEVWPTDEQHAADSAYTEEDAAPDDAERVVVLGPVN